MSDEDAKPSSVPNTGWKQDLFSSEASEPFLVDPGDILGHPTLSVQEKRAILMEWLSDVHIVPDAPRWRQFENGAFVDSYDLREALRKLEDIEKEEARQ